MHKMLCMACLSLGAILCSPQAVSEQETTSNWPQFRGPGARGVVDSDALPVQWSATENVAWQTPIPGKGWSSPVVWGHHVFLTTVLNAADQEAPGKGLYFGGERPEPPKAPNQWKVFCLDLGSGQVLWERTVHEGAPASGTHIKNSYASETPVVDGEHVYAYFGNVGIWCLGFRGDTVWHKAIPPQRTRASWGTAASPLLHEDRLYIVNDNDEESYLLALNKKTGDELWRTPREEKSNWSTPFLWQHEQRTEIVTAGSGNNRAYDLEGKPLWWFTGMSSITIATPYAADGLLYLSSGFVGDRRRPLYAVRPGADGDISLEEGQTSNAWIAWSHPQAAPYNPSTLVYDGQLYVLYDGGFLASFDARTGETVYERQRIPDARNFTASPWGYQGRVFCLNEDGVTYVIKAGDTLELLNTNTLGGGEKEMFLASPAIAGNRLLIRSSAHLYCISAEK